MTTTTLENWLEALKADRSTTQTAYIVDGIVKPFSGDGFGLDCPWLRWRIGLQRKLQRGTLNPPGLLLMQDWGNIDQTVDEAVAEITAALTKTSGDTTLRNLFSGYWREAIVEGDWLVSNAVWGLRSKKLGKPTAKCGYLGDFVHKQMFLTWGSLVVRLARDANKDFTLVLAGEWARFPAFPLDDASEDLATYLERWRVWVTTGRNRIDREEMPEELQLSFDDCKGKAVCVPHPVLWRSGRGHDWTTGPNQ